MATISRIPSPSSVFSAYASLSASVMLVQTAINQLIPRTVQNYISSAIRYYFKAKSSNLVLLIEESDGISSNEIYTAAETYLYSKIDSSVECLKISKSPKEKGINVKFAQCEKIVDTYDGVEVVWRFSCEERKRGSSNHLVDDESGNVLPEYEKRYFEMSFNKRNKDMVLNSYIPHILQISKNIKDEKKVVKLHTLSSFPYSSTFIWESINLEHPSTFETLAMDTELKKAIIEDMDRFVRRKDFYRKVGKAWKRGYLLHGPPGTGKSSLIAAMANYLKFDIYDLELANIRNDSDLRKLLLKTANRSILVIEDIDCSVELPDRKGNSGLAEGRYYKEHQFHSRLLNFIDGLWSSCGDERIIIFTTNNKDRLDPALIRPGRMDMHIEMSYLTRDGFRTLTTNYLNINNPHWRFGEIEELIGSMNVTPAEVAEELMKSDDPDVSLGGLCQFLKLKRKKMEEDDGVNGDDGSSRDEEGHGTDQSPKGKRLKLDNGKDELLRRLQWCLDDPALVMP
ncbi:OLC1v1010919C1 [Oldenlandia corymbosa var. corymbosa]|uniref:OLC1v1010919C1 n=1 Tax=Oldenlandia corymbosa var. corymbosa TaxID=529605 RepID=A0AAV1DV81_OLDCO|nr:OLC1v1010919C1 [Oldenlandia corymbosa var. corymbosa]